MVMALNPLITQFNVLVAPLFNHRKLPLNTVLDTDHFWGRHTKELLKWLSIESRDKGLSA